MHAGPNQKTQSSLGNFFKRAAASICAVGSPRKIQKPVDGVLKRPSAAEVAAAEAVEEAVLKRPSAAPRATPAAAATGAAAGTATKAATPAAAGEQQQEQQAEATPKAVAATGTADSAVVDEFEATATPMWFGPEATGNDTERSTSDGEGEVAPSNMSWRDLVASPDRKKPFADELCLPCAPPGDVALEASFRCEHCAAPVDLSKPGYRITTKSSRSEIKGKCAGCNSTYTQLAKHFPSWPIDSFKSLEETTKQQFYAQCRNQSSSKAIRDILVSTISVQRTEFQKTMKSGAAYPLSVWGQMGWDTAVIKAKAKPGDIEKNDYGMDCYRVRVSIVEEGKIQEETRTEVLKLWDSHKPEKSRPGRSNRGRRRRRRSTSPHSSESHSSRSRTPRRERSGTSRPAGSGSRRGRSPSPPPTRGGSVRSRSAASDIGDSAISGLSEKEKQQILESRAKQQTAEDKKKEKEEQRQADKQKKEQEKKRAAELAKIKKETEKISAKALAYVSPALAKLDLALDHPKFHEALSTHQKKEAKEYQKKLTSLKKLAAAKIASASLDDHEKEQLEAAKTLCDKAVEVTASINACCKD